MALRPYWQKHPVQLRAAAILSLICLPLVAICFAMWAAWEERGELAKYIKDAWSLIWKGRI